MPRFDYNATDAKGAPASGVVDAPDRESAMQALVDRGFSVSSLAEEEAKTLLNFELSFLDRVKIEDVVVFSRQFSVLMGAKVPIVKALKVMVRQTQSKKLRQILQDVAGEVEAGTALSAAMAKYPKVFGEFYVNMVRSGETTGRLEEVMNYLADQTERDYDLTQKIKGAMTYPIFVLFGLVVVGFVMMTFVVPKLTATLIESGTDLPWTTKGLIAVSGFFQAYAIQIVIGAVLFAIAFRRFIATPTGRELWDEQKLYIPVFGPLLQRIYLVRITRSMSTLLTGGVDIPRALDIVSDVVGNAHYRALLVRTKKAVSDGNSIVSEFEKHPRAVPNMVPQMMSVGEETGRLGEVLGRLTSFYERDLQNKVANLVSAIEPLIMLVMGGAVGVMVAAILLPMYNLATQF